ncbi:MAG: L-sorbosone dehydrogenase [Pirellulaceae bacterium]|nr:MAG: L-sorbosone dehydrogenase [Pirellulaceae bacterium]
MERKITIFGGVTGRAILSKVRPIVLAAVAWSVSVSGFGIAVGQEYRPVEVPAVWKNPPAELSRSGGYAWFCCRVAVPASWRGRSCELWAEAADDVRQYFINGRPVGQSGRFPPAFRSGLGGPEKFAIPAEALRPGEDNVVAVRLYLQEARLNFNVAAPVLAADPDAILLRGTWYMALGDWPPDQVARASDAPRFDQVISSEQARSTWKLLEGDRGPQSPQQALAQMHTADGLRVELVLSEPQVRQPLSIKFDERGRMWVLQYLQYPNPAGLTPVSRDKHLRTVWDKIPPPPPHHFTGQDQITIHEDTDGDGKYDQHKVFLSGLNLATSFEFDRDGVWVLNPPYLLFYYDRDHDDRPDGPPEVHLEGFGLEDSHSLTNNLRWGPDGWLYAAQGSTVSADVRRYGTQEKPVHSMGQLIWRYHPASRRYEIFAEGGGNAFGLEIDMAGRMFSGHNGGDTRGFHYVQGGYYQKGFGKHGDLSNPYAYGYFPPMRHHQVPRFTHAFLIYEADLLPDSYRGLLFGVAPLLSHVVMSLMERDGATFKTHDVGLALWSDDPWFRPVDIQLGPEGAVYICDFYEQRIDHASHYQGRIHRESGRIYRLVPASGQVQAGKLPAQMTGQELVDALASRNRWVRQTALRLLRQRRPIEVVDRLERMLRDRNDDSAVWALWALYAFLGDEDPLWREALEHPQAAVRWWAVRLAGDDGEVSSEAAEELRRRAAVEADVEVRCQLAATARRLPAAVAWPIINELVRHREDVSDPFVPLMLWWAIEKHIDQGREGLLALAADAQWWHQPLVEQHLLEHIMRRFAASGQRRDLVTAARLLELAPDEASAQRLLAGFEKAYEGRLLAGLPEELLRQLARYGGGSFVLRLRQADPEALAKALQQIADPQTPKKDRIAYIQVLGQIRHRPAIRPLLEIAAQDADIDVRAAALAALASFDDELIGQRLSASLTQFPKPVREAAEATLLARPSWTRLLLDALQDGKIAPDQLAPTTVARLQWLSDPELAQLARQLLADRLTGASESDRQLMEHIEQLLLEASGNPYRGRTLFLEHCGKCHKLFQQGGQIGPDLTAFRRDDVKRLLVNIINPSLEIREGYENHLVITQDGRTINGFLVDQDGQTLTLRTPDGQLVTLVRDEIEESYVLPKSIMPEGLLRDWPEQDIRDLFAYLRASQPLPE